MNSKKSINSFKIERDRLPNYLLNNVFSQFVDNFSELLLYKMN